MNNLEISLLLLFILFLILFYISNFVYNKYLIDSTQEPFSGHLKQSDLDAAIAEKQRIQQKLQGLENDLTTFTNQVKLFKDKSEGNKAALTELDEYRKMYYGEFNNQINLIRGLLNSQNSNLGGITNSYLTNMATFETFTNNMDERRYATKVYVGNSNTNPKIITLEDQGIDEVQTNYINKWAGRQCHGTNSCGVGDNFNTEIFTDTDGLKKLKVTRLDNDSGWGMRLELPAKTTNRPIGQNDNVYDFDQKIQILQETDAENQEKLDTLTARINGVNDLITTFDPNDKNVYSPVPASYQQDDTQQDDTQQFEYTPISTQPLPPVIVDHSQTQLSANARAAIQNASADDARYATEIAAQEDKRKVELYDQINNAWNAADKTSVPRRKGYSPSYSNNNINNYDDYVKNTNVGNFVIKENDNHELRETNSGWDKRPNKWDDSKWKSVFKTHLPQYSDKLPSNWNNMTGYNKTRNVADKNNKYRKKLETGVLADRKFYRRMDEVGRHNAHELRARHNHYAHNTWHPRWKRNLYPYKYNCDTKYYKSAPPPPDSHWKILRHYHKNGDFIFSDDITYGSEKAYELCKSQ